MKMIKTLTLGCATLCYLAAAAMPVAGALAQDDYKPNRKSNEPTREQIEELGLSGILPLEDIDYYFVHDPKASEDDLVFRAAIPLEVQGCFQVYEPEMKSEIVGKSLNLEVKMPIVTSPYSSTTKPDCQLRNSFAADTRISRKALMDNGVNKFRMKSHYGAIMRDLEVTEHFVRISDPGDKRMKPYTYWTLPPNAVVLSVPMFKGDMLDNNTQLQQLARVAKIKKLVPIESEVPDYMPANANTNRFFFLDTRGDVVGLLNETGEPIIIGQVHSKEPFYGPNGLYDKETGVDILATLPGSND